MPTPKFLMNHKTGLQIAIYQPCSLTTFATSCLLITFQLLELSLIFLVLYVSATQPVPPHERRGIVSIEVVVVEIMEPST